MNKNFFLLLIIISIISSLAILCGCIEDESSDVNSITIEGKDGFYSTIMEAINKSSEGDTILVSKGIYNETFSIDKSITLIGENKDNTIIRGNNTDDLINITANYVNISGFTIKNSGDKFSQGVYSSIYISSDYIIISDNNISSNKNYGLYLTSGSKNNKIFNNFFSENRNSIYLYNGNENNIYSNDFLYNTDYGIYLASRSNNNLIYNNVFSENRCGIRIKSSEGNEITQNLFANNVQGVYCCCGARYNIVFLNSFKNNSLLNANDRNINSWDNGTYGNYWDDYDGLDSDGNGIGDTSYVVSYSKKRDNYPLMESFEIFIARGY